MTDLWMHSSKYDGSLHYKYPVRVIEQSPDQLTTYFAPGTPVESYRGSWNGTRHMLSMFWRDRSHVLHVAWETSWQPKFIYVDITTGTQWDDRVVRYIDLDLDLILRHGTEAIHLDDEDEFEEHRLKWNYPTELVRECWAAVEEVRQLFGAAKEPFSPSMFAWRPGAAR